MVLDGLQYSHAEQCKAVGHHSFHQKSAISQMHCCTSYNNFVSPAGMIALPNVLLGITSPNLKAAALVSCSRGCLLYFNVASAVCSLKSARPSAQTLAIFSSGWSRVLFFAADCCGVLVQVVSLKTVAGNL